MVCVGTPEFTTAMAHMLYCFLYCLYDAANTFQLGWVGGAWVSFLLPFWIGFCALQITFTREHCFVSSL